jgi:hypothetical protein
MKKNRKKDEYKGEDVRSEKITKRPYAKPVMKEHNTLDKVSGCGLYSDAYVSGYGYWY